MYVCDERFSYEDWGKSNTKVNQISPCGCQVNSLTK